MTPRCETCGVEYGPEPGYVSAKCPACLRASCPEQSNYRPGPDVTVPLADWVTIHRLATTAEGRIDEARRALDGVDEEDPS